MRAFVRYNGAGSWGWLDRIEARVADALDIFPGDIRDAHAVRQAVDGCDVVFHLAALIGIPYSYRAPQSYVDTNITGTANVLQAATDLGVGRVVQTSTSEVYGTARRVPIGEDHRLHPQSPYAASKVGADQIALAYARSFDTPVVVVRPFNSYGPRQSARAVIATVIAQLADGARQIRLGALTPTRDFTYVSDTVAGFVAAARADAAIGEVVNLGTNFDIAIGEVAEMVAEIMGAEIEIVADDERRRPAASEVERLLCDNGRAARLLGWRPAYHGRGGLRRGLEATIDWFADPANRAAYKPHVYCV